MKSQEWAWGKGRVQLPMLRGILVPGVVLGTSLHHFRAAYNSSAVGGVSNLFLENRGNCRHKH